MSKNKGTARSFATQKRRRRQWLTFWRMCRYGINNFTRNAWLTIAATAVMTITLLIILITVAAHNILNDSVVEISKKVDMSIYLKSDTTDDQANVIANDLTKLSNVTHVAYISPAQARADFAEKNKADAKTLEALNAASNEFFGTLRINLKDINDVSQLDTFVKSNDNVKKYLDPNRAPSFAGDRRNAIQGLARWTDFAQKAGIVASIIFIAISSLIVFNTIRMAIFNRKDEIEMMKLIGADREFIRGPFVVEAMVYGFIAGLIATGLGYLILNAAGPKLADYGVAIQPTVDFMTTYIPFAILAMVTLGALVGAISSLLATRKYLKI